MHVRTALLLILLPFSAVAADVSRNVPDRFLGNWCTQPLPNEEDTGESDIRISAHEIGYYYVNGKILAAAAIGDQLALIVQLQDEGRTWLSTHELELSRSGKSLTELRDDGQLRTRVRCHSSAQPPPNNSFKPTPLRSAA